MSSRTFKILYIDVLDLYKKDLDRGLQYTKDCKKIKLTFESKHEDFKR